MEYRGVYISTTPDCGCNTGGYFCQVYSDKDMEYEIDYFCIHPDELAANPDVDYWIREYVDAQCYGYEEKLHASGSQGIDSQAEMTM